MNTTSVLGAVCSVTSQLRQIVDNRGETWVFLSKSLAEEFHRLKVQRLCFCQPVRGLKQHSQIVEVYCNVGVFLSEGGFVDGQRATHQRLCLFQSVRSLE